MTEILIVDDSPFQRGLIRSALQGDGYQTLEAANGMDGLQQAGSRSPDAIVLDLVMPEMTGFEVLEALRERGQEPPVIVLSADIQESTRTRCMELGAKVMLTKPVSNSELLSALHEVLGAG